MTHDDLWCRLTVFDAGGARLLRCTARGPGRPGIEIVDGVAALHLAAVRAGGRVVMLDVNPDLAELLDLAGLGELGGSGRQAGGQPEGREDAGDIEEDVVGPDAPV